VRVCGRRSCFLLEASLDAVKEGSDAVKEGGGEGGRETTQKTDL